MQAKCADGGRRYLPGWQVLLLGLGLAACTGNIQADDDAGIGDGSTVGGRTADGPGGAQGAAHCAKGADRPGCAAPSEPGADPKYSEQSERLMIDMTALALKCDLTRYASFMVSYGGSSIGPAPNQHALTHARDRPQTVPITQLQVSFFAQLLGRLSARAQRRLRAQQRQSARGSGR